MKMSNKEKYKCFVIMPYGKSEEEKRMFNDIFTKAIQSTANRILGFEIVFDRADINLKAFEFMKHVHKHIDDCHFCLADITGLNNNVLYEMGYAKAKGKDIIVISQENNSPYPIDISNMTITKYSAKDDDDFEILSQKLAGLVEKAIDFIKIRTYSIKDAYEVKCYQNRKAADLNAAFRKAIIKISILQTNLDTMEKENYLDSLEYALQNNKQLGLRILTLDPDSYFAQKRAEQIGLAIAHYRNELHASIQSVIDRLSKFGGQFSLRIYDDFPTQITYIIDDFVYPCTVARNMRSRELCTFMLDRFAAGVERSFLFHFDAIWANAKAYEAHTLQSISGDVNI